MKKRVRQMIGAGLLALALTGMIWSVSQHFTSDEQIQVQTRTEVNMDESISVLP